MEWGGCAARRGLRRAPSACRPVHPSPLTAAMTMRVCPAAGDRSEGPLAPVSPAASTQHSTRPVSLAQASNCSTQCLAAQVPPARFPSVGFLTAEQMREAWLAHSAPSDLPGCCRAMRQVSARTDAVQAAVAGLEFVTALESLDLRWEADLLVIMLAISLDTNPRAIDWPGVGKRVIRTDPDPDRLPPPCRFASLSPPVSLQNSRSCFVLSFGCWLR